MKLTNGLILLWMALFWMPIQAVAQKEFKPIRAAIKAKNGSEAMNLVERYEKDSILSQLPKLYDYGIQAQILINDAENVKAYLKQKYDTVRFFQSTCSIYEYVIKCDKAELALLALKGQKPKFQKANRQLLHQFYKNLGMGGRFFFAKGKYQEAMNLMSYYLETPLQPIWGADKDVTRKSEYTENAYIYQRAAFFSGNYSQVEQYKEQTLADTNYRRGAFELLARAAESRGDTVMMYHYLREGLTDYPGDTFFFTRMTDYFNHHDDFHNALVLADSLLERYPNQLLYLASRTVSLMNLHQYEEAIEAGKQCLELDSTIVDMHLYIGAAYCSLAGAVTLPTNINSRSYRNSMERIQSYYREALPYLENYRREHPELQDKWLPLLERIYWNLNMGEKYEEIEQLVKE